MSTITDISQKGMTDHVSARAKKGLTLDLNNQWQDFKALEELVDNMYAIRDGSSLGCSSHGSDTQGDNLPKTTCSSHSKVYDKNDLSLGGFKNAFEIMTKCSCDSNSVSGCYCVSNCTCNCNSDCCVSDCCVGNCSCNSDTGI